MVLQPHRRAPAYQRVQSVALLIDTSAFLIRDGRLTTVTIFACAAVCIDGG